MSDADKPVKLHMELMRRCIEATAPHEASLAPDVLRRVALAEIAIWLDAQDESNDPGRVLMQAQAAVGAINAKYSG